MIQKNSTDTKQVQTMRPRKLNLDKISIAAPCPIQWNDMVGDEQVRFCSVCKLNVYNISEMTRTDAEKFLSKQTARSCLRLYRRKDGTLITKDCPIGRKIADQVSNRLRIAAATFVAIFNATVVFAQQPQLKLPEGIGRAEAPRDVNGGSFDPSVIDERHYSEGRPERRQKTSPTLPEGSPIPDVHSGQVKLKADTSAMDAFITARSYEKEKQTARAIESYELAISSLRSGRERHDTLFAKQVANHYAKLLRKQNQRDKAKQIQIRTFP